MRERPTFRTTLLLVSDAGITYAAVLFALFLRLGMEGMVAELDEGYGWAKPAVITLFCLIAFYVFDLYDYAVINNRVELRLRLIQALGTAWLTLAVVFFVLPSLEIGRGTAAYSIIISVVGILGLRIGIHFLLGHPDLGTRILIVGDGPVAIETAEAAINRRDKGYRIVGFITDEFSEIERKYTWAKRLGHMGELEEIVRFKSIDRVVIGIREQRGEFPVEALLRLRLAGIVAIEESPSFIERVAGHVYLEMLRPSWLIFSHFRPDTRVKTLAREVLYRFLALVGLVVSAPIAIAAAVCIKLNSRGPFLYRQQRVGKNGRIFELIKFRSMKVDAEKTGSPIWASANDDRATGVGRFIRKIRVDEIPQFWNILKGEMSFIGPRPERPEFVEQLSKEIRFYEHRHLVAPGLTGWAQIQYPYGASVEDARRKLEYDLYYIKNQSVTLDVLILLETVKTILFGRGGR
ncbi:MAG: TIGR03013 family XrtA/PEP-CTERM system glycosyltransferase [Acidobacteriota bacterium]